MKRIIRLPMLAAAIVIAVVLAPLAPTPTSRATAQVMQLRFQSNTYYSPYGQGRYGHYGQRYGARGMLGRSAYGYSGYGVTPYGYGGSSGYRYGNSYNRSAGPFGSGRDPYIRSFGGAGYYQPYDSGVYFGFGGY